MELKSIRSGNYLQHSKKLIEVCKVDIKKEIVLIVDSTDYFLSFEVRPVIIHTTLAQILITNNLKDFDDNFVRQSYKLAFKDIQSLHELQNRFEDMYGWSLEIDLPTFCLIQQSIK